MFDKLKRLLEGAVAQVNPFDNGKTFASVQKKPAQTPPPNQVRKPSPASTAFNAISTAINPANAIARVALPHIGRAIGNVKLPTATPITVNEFVRAIPQAAHDVGNMLPIVHEAIEFGQKKNPTLGDLTGGISGVGYTNSPLGAASRTAGRVVATVRQQPFHVPGVKTSQPVNREVGEADGLLNKGLAVAGIIGDALGSKDVALVGNKTGRVVGNAAKTAYQDDLILGPSAPAPQRGSVPLPGRPAPAPTPAPVKGAPTDLAAPTAAPTAAPDAAQRVVDLLGGAKTGRLAQERLYSQARSQKLGRAMGVGENVGGQAGYKAQLSALKGPLPKQQFENLAGKLDQPTIDSLFDQVRSNPNIRGFDEINTQTALAKLFDKDAGVPTRSDIKHLRNAFGNDFADAVANNISTLQKLKQGAFEVLTLPRSLMSTLDMSAPFRQGLVLSTRYPKQFASSFRDMFKAAASPKAYKAIIDEIAERPSFELMRKSGLALTDVGTDLASREEMFMSNLAERIPGVSIPIRASSRAYTGFLNKLRADVFDHLVTNAKSAGLDLIDNPHITRDIATFVNTSSGRGGLGPLENSAVALNSFFFSPRLMASRMQILNPAYYAKLDPFVRKQALQSTAALGGAVLTILSMAKLAGAEVGADPRSADFGKIKLGNTRIDIAGGFQQYIKFAAQMATGEIVSSTTGKVMSLTEEGFGKMNRQDIAIRFLQGKENPTASFVTDWLKNKDFEGNPFDLKKAVTDRMKPMVIGTGQEIAQNNPEHLPLLGLGTFGFGVQNYAPKAKTQAPKTQVKEGKSASSAPGKGQQSYQATYGEGYESAPDSLKSSASRVAAAHTKYGGAEVPNEAKDVLFRYARLTETGRDKFKSDPQNTFKLATAQYVADKATGRLSDTEDYSRQKSLRKMAVTSAYSRDVVDMAGMSKSGLTDFLAKNPNKASLLGQVFRLDQQLADAGMLAKPKFGNTLAKKTGAKKKTGRKTAKGRTIKTVDMGASSSKLRSLLAGTKSFTTSSSNIKARKVAMRKVA